MVWRYGAHGQKWPYCAFGLPSEPFRKLIYDPQVVHEFWSGVSSRLLESAGGSAARTVSRHSAVSQSQPFTRSDLSCGPANVRGHKKQTFMKLVQVLSKETLLLEHSLLRVTSGTLK
jgi:hypothetical protein